VFILLNYKVRRDLNQTKLNPAISKRVTEFHKKLALFTGYSMAKHISRKVSSYYSPFNKIEYRSAN
jgi:hypothetical protein